MISLEQVLLLETRVAKAIDYVKKVNAENAALISEREALQAKLSANQKRIDELEVHVMRFKEDQGRIEDGIIAALDRLSQFEDAFEQSLKDKAAVKKSTVKKQEAAQQQAAAADSSVSPEVFFEIPASEAEPKKGEGELDIF
jgi:predicted nuclease with TOPRIM domain